MAESAQSTKPWQSEIKSLKAGILYIYNTKELADIILKVSDRKFKAHQLLLGARSPKLAEMLLKTNLGYPKELDLTTEGVSEDGFEKLLHYIYTDELLNEDDILEAYRAAKLFEQKGMLNKCREIIENIRIDNDNVCTFLKEASEVDVLKTRCLDYVKRNAESVLKLDGFIELSDENVRELLEGGYFKNVPTMVVVTNYLRWGRSQFAPQDNYRLVRDLLLQTDKPLLGQLGIEKLSSTDLAELVTECKELLTMEESMQFFVRANKPGTSALPKWCVCNE